MDGKKLDKELGSRRYDSILLKHVGQDVFISADAEIRRPHLVIVGDHVSIDKGVLLTTQVELGDFIHIGPHVSVIGGAKGLLRMGNFTNIALDSRVICISDTFAGDGLISAPGIPADFTSLKIKPVVFENFANVGANVTIMPGVTLGEGSVVGVGSLVMKDTEPWTIYAGSPARPIKSRPKRIMLEYAAKLGYIGGNR